jgi:hypothetical protein
MIILYHKVCRLNLKFANIIKLALILIKLSIKLYY